jgi:tetratricopeptide (TPR) repeat protein
MADDVTNGEGVVDPESTAVAGLPAPEAGAQYDEFDDEYEDDEYEDEPGVPIRDDRVASAMMLASLALIAVLLVTAISMVLFLLSLRHAPRTSAERQVTEAEAQANIEPAKAQNWVTLAYAYAEAGRYRDALTAIERGRPIAKGAMDLVQADVYRMSGQYRQAIPLYDKALLYIDQEEQKAFRAQEKKGIFTQQPNRTRAVALYGKGLCQLQLGEAKKAAENIKKASDIIPTDSIMLVSLGDAYAAAKQPALAEKAYKQALAMIPGYEPALEGLEKLKGGK